MEITTDVVLKNMKISLSEKEIIDHLVHDLIGDSAWKECQPWGWENHLYIRDNVVGYEIDVSTHGSPSYVLHDILSDPLKVKKFKLLKRYAELLGGSQ